MKKYNVIALMLALCLSLSACGGKEPAASGGAVTFTDDLGRTVTVDNPRRTAALLGSFAQIWDLAGGTVCAAPDDAWKDLNLNLGEDAVDLGSTHSLSLELLLASRPEFILASTNTRQNVEWRDTLEATNIPIAYFDVNSFEDYLKLLNICTDITGRKDLYETYGTAVQQQIEAVIARSRARLEGESGPTVLCAVASASTLKAKNSGGNVLCAILRDLGCINIADSDAMLLEELSIERILEADPDYIFFVQRGDNTEGMYDYVRSTLTDNPAWSSLTAVKQDRVFFMEKDLYNLKPNHRWGEAYEKAEEILANG